MAETHAEDEIGLKLRGGAPFGVKIIFIYSMRKEVLVIVYRKRKSNGAF